MQRPLFFIWQEGMDKKDCANMQIGRLKVCS